MSRSLRVVVAPDSFGGALDSVGVAAAISDGWLRVRPDDEVVRRPMADGGEGTLAAVADALGEAAELRTVETVDALGRPIEASWLLLDGGRGAFVEVAAASGLARLAGEE
ncbi:MAG: glycerate kinase, partial [Candidatus Limnocylindria bacterium]